MIERCHAARFLLKPPTLFRIDLGVAAVQALECGLPIVAREGRFLRGRLGSGVLRHLGLDELVASSDDAYVELAVALPATMPYILTGMRLAMGNSFLTIVSTCA